MRLSLFIMMIMCIIYIPLRNNLYNSFNIIINIVARTFYAISNNYGKCVFFFFSVCSTYTMFAIISLSVSRTNLMQFQRVGYGAIDLHEQERSCRTW